jgi:hypothetical protein
MTNVQRRSFMKGIVGLPIVGGIAKWYLFSDSTASDPPEAIERKRGISILRLFTTAQERYRHRFGHYTDLSILSTKGLIQEVAAIRQAEYRGFGHTLLSSLSLDRPEVSPGWNFASRTNESASAYVFLLTSSIAGVNSLASDDRAVIYEGQPRHHLVEYVPAVDLISGGPLGTQARKTKPSRLESLLKGFALGPETVHADPNGCNGCCTSDGCFCTPWWNSNTFYCGCTNCQWCSYMTWCTC